MACPIKTPDGEINEDALHDLVQIGGFIVEGGIKNQPEWAQAMKTKVGDIFNNGDLQTIWANVRADAGERTGTKQTATKADVFIDNMAGKLGNLRAAADFANALVGPNGDTTIMNKIIDANPKNPLTPAEEKVVAKAIKDHIVDRKPGVKATEGPMGVINGVVDRAREETGKKSTVDPVTRTLKASLGKNLANFATDVESQHPGIMERLKAGTATPAELEAAGKGVAKHAPTRAVNAITDAQAQLKGAVKQARIDAKSPAVPKPKPDVVPKVKMSDIPQTEQSKFGQRVKASLKGNTDAFFDELRNDHRDIANALDKNPESLTDEQNKRLGDLFVKHFPDAVTPAKATGMVKALNDAVKEVKADAATAAREAKESVPSARRDESPGRYKVAPEKGGGGYPDQGLPEGPHDDTVFDRHMASTLGNTERAAQFREDLGEDLYTKIVNREKLTPAETDAATKAFAKNVGPRNASSPSEISQFLKPIATEARASVARQEAEAKTETFDKAREWVREQLAGYLPDRRLDEMNAALNRVPDGDHPGLNHVFNLYAPRSWGKTLKLAAQSGFLSNPASLATALYSHLLSAGIDQGPAKFIANKLSGGLHAGVNSREIAHSIASSARQFGGIATLGKYGDKESADILKHGENSLTLEGRNTLHPAGTPLRPEFTVGSGGTVGNTVNAVGRVSGRQHGAVWHAVGVGLDEIARRDAAHYTAIDEAEASGKKTSPEEIKQRANELYDAPTQKVLDYAQRLRQEQMFQNKNAVGEALSGNGISDETTRNIVQGVTAPVIPFSTVATNLGGRAIEHTVPGAIASIAKELVKASRSQPEQLPLTSLANLKAVLKAMPAIDRAHLYKIMARGIVGTVATTVGGYGGYNAGVVNAPDPSKGEYGSINAFNQKWEIGRTFGPFAAPVLLGADAARNQKFGGVPFPTGQDFWEASQDNPFSNAGEMLHDFSGKDRVGRGKPNGMMKAAAAYTSPVVPSFIRSVAAASDPTHALRDANSDQFAQYLWNKMKMATPGLRETLPSKSYPDASTVLPVARHVPDPNGNFGINFLKEWEAARNSRQPHK